MSRSGIHMKIVKIWDLPTRVFHWLLALTVVFAIITAKLGGNWMDWHMRLGYAVVGLLAFRLIWGVAGGHWARFKHWPLSWHAMRRYLRGTPLAGEVAGHSATGSWASVAMLVTLTAQVGTGLIADDEIASAGPLAHWVGSAASSLATGYHHEVGQLVLLVLIAMHLSAVAVYTVVKKQDLLMAMVRGYKVLPAAVTQSADDVRARVVGLGLLVVLISAAVWVLY